MPARAQDADTTDAASDIAMYVQLPDSVVVTATRQKADARLTGRRVSVWTQADIQALPVFVRRAAAHCGRRGGAQPGRWWLLGASVRL